MYDLIEQLKQRPEHHRRRIAFGLSGGITAIIFVLWASVILPQDTRQIAIQSKQVAPSTEETPISTLRNGVAQVYEAFRGLMQSTQEGTKSVDFEAEYKKIKTQVEKGEIDLAPGTLPQNEDSNQIP